MPGKTDPFDNLIFEVNCLGCGHVAFSLPYREGTHHTMTCHRCGEVTIAHVLPGGHVAVATFEQRAAALERIKREVESVFNSWDVVAEESAFAYQKRIPLPHRRVDHEVDTLRFTAKSMKMELARQSWRESKPTCGPGILEAYASLRLRPEGLQLRLATIEFGVRRIFPVGVSVDTGYVSTHLPEVPRGIADLDGTLLVEPRVPPPNPKGTSAT